MRTVISKNDSLEIYEKAEAYLNKTFSNFTKSSHGENGGDAYVITYKSGDKEIRLINDCFIDVNVIEANFDFEVPKFE